MSRPPDQPQRRRVLGSNNTTPTARTGGAVRASPSVTFGQQSQQTTPTTSTSAKTVSFNAARVHQPQKPVVARVDRSVLQRATPESSPVVVAASRATASTNSARSAPSTPTLASTTFQSPSTTTARTSSPTVFRVPSPTRPKSPDKTPKLGSSTSLQSPHDVRPRATLSHLPAGISSRTLNASTPPALRPSAQSPQLRAASGSSSGSTTLSTPLTSPAESTTAFDLVNQSPLLGKNDAKPVIRATPSSEALLPAHRIRPGLAHSQSSSSLSNAGRRAGMSPTLRKDSDDGPAVRRQLSSVSVRSTTTRPARALSVTSTGSTSSALSGQTVDEGLRAPKSNEREPPQRAKHVRQQSIEDIVEEQREREARVERKIMDLEITNTSLLSINANLERLKLAQTSEIRELRRRLRESRGFVPLPSTAPAEGVHSSDAEDASDQEDEQSWESILADDPHFAAVAVTVDNLIKRAKQALDREIAPSELQGRVLNPLELETRSDGAVISAAPSNNARQTTDVPPSANALVAPTRIGTDLVREDGGDHNAGLGISLRT